jgi:hypothetical protein
MTPSDYLAAGTGTGSSGGTTINTTAPLPLKAKMLLDKTRFWTRPIQKNNHKQSKMPIFPRWHTFEMRLGRLGHGLVV